MRHTYSIVTKLSIFVHDDRKTSSMHAFYCHIFPHHIFVTGCPAGNVNLPLIGGTSDRSGLVEVCVGGDYFPISTSSFTVNEASVLCRSVGLGNGVMNM